jgi:hypothetical protein
MRPEDATDGLAAPALDDVLARARHAASCSDVQTSDNSRKEE